MGATETVAHLCAFERRGAGTDTERRAALWLAEELAVSGREARLESFWCRPNWALAHAWHAALAVAGSIVSVYAPRPGGAVLLVALLSVVADAFTGTSLGRRLTPEHASQNVVSSATKDGAQRVHLILTANYDAGRAGFFYREGFRAITARMRTATGGLTPGWLGWFSIAIAWLVAVAILRVEGDHGRTIGALQLPPTAALLVAFAALLEIASADFSPAAGDNGSGVAAAVAVARALDAAPPRHLTVEVVLQGAGDVTGIGLSKHLRARRRELKRANTVVLGIAACGAGQPRWWTSDGPLVPLRYFRRLRNLCGELATREPQLGARAHHGRGSSPALNARLKRLPAIAFGCLDHRDIVPRAHRAGDSADALDARALASTIEFGLILVDAVEAAVGETRRAERAIPA
jgi:hypothetical protein